ncbi:coenzyme F390 synthetase FtsA [Asticcacaulis biprosthecium C19]|uniref:Coenzyme F390 synthetase FtsA n=1 Tax=Asticcacaulis biprosthecium C19 TaxID=715226 RepID=F4QHZ1_9CAUL|nr:hypothetical protein [Asticcacaulis biprosthecium]EGF91702.1 coenzyme F390 synthetase FtsA [Asticcacaulis biprosthecium C19]
MLGALFAYAGAHGPPPTREALEQQQRRLWCRLQERFSFAPALADHAAKPLTDVPVITVARFRADFAGYNTEGVDVGAATQAALAAETGGASSLPMGLEAGFSTGTGGGPRGLFLTSPRERRLYGARLAGKLFGPLELVRTQRIAVCLRAPNRLYEKRRVRFFGLAGDDRDAAIAAYDPQLLIAPPQVLIDLAQVTRPLPSLRRLFYGAETLNAAERDFVTGRLGRRPDPIYQATEGFLGAPCRLGTLHLNEDALIVERAPLGGDRFQPIVTDLIRQTQLVVRLKLDDILRPTSCACGSPLMAVEPVEGRVQDIWRWGEQVVFPGEVEAVVSQLVPPGRPWIVTGHADGITCACETGDAPALLQALSAFGQPVSWQPYDRNLDFPKRRHVRWRP